MELPGEIIYETHPLSEKVVAWYEMLASTESVRPDEIYFLRRYLVQKEWISFDRGAYTFVVTIPGYSHLAELQQHSVNSSQAFVAMWFDPMMDGAYEKGIAPGITSAGYKPMRIDRRDHNNKIDDEIIAEIRRSRFLVADFTQDDSGARGGVYYEAGFAQGLNIPVIFTCREDAISKVHFDTRQYNHITWQEPEDLKKRLADRIARTIGDGPWKAGT